MRHDPTHEARLTAFALGGDDLDAPAREAEIRAQLQGCPECFDLACAWLRNQRIARLERVVTDVLAAPEAEALPAPLQPTPPAPRASRWALAAGLTLAAAGAAYLWATRDPPAPAPPPPAATPDQRPREDDASVCRDPATGKVLDRRAPDRVLEANTGAGGVLAFDDRGHLVTGGADGRVRVWSWADGSLVRTLPGHDSRVLSFAFAPDGTMATLADDDQAARLWSPDGRLIAALPKEPVGAATKPFRMGAFSPDGQVFLTAGDSEVVQLWRRDGTALRRLEGHTQAVAWATFSPDGARIVTAGRDRRGGLYETATGAVTWLASHGDWLRQAGFTQDGRHAFTCADDGRLRWFETATGRAHEVAVSQAGLRQCRLSADGKSLLVTDELGRAVVGSAAPEAFERTLTVAVPEGVHGLVLGGQGRRVGSVESNECTLIWSGGRAVQALDTGPGTLALSPDETLAAVSGPDGRVRLWRLE